MIDANTATTITCTFVVIMAAIATAFAIVRIVKGPTDTDRIIGLDIMFSAALFISIISALLTGRTVFIDVGLGLSLVGFIGTIGWARLIKLGALVDSNHRDYTP